MWYVFFALIRLDMIAFYGLLLGFLLSFTSRKRFGRRLMTLSSVFLILIAITPLTRYGIEILEDRFPKPTLPEKVDGLILLGGNFALHESAERAFPVHNLAGSRLYEFMVLMRRYPETKVVFLGTPAEAKLTQYVLTQHGIDSSHVIFGDQSQTTRDHVSYLPKIVPHQPGEKWVLVTSAFHMPRSVGLFRGAHWDVIPYPVDYHTSGKTRGIFSYDRYAFLAWDVLVRQVAGFVNDWLEGLSPEFFPKPQSVSQSKNS